MSGVFVVSGEPREAAGRCVGGVQDAVGKMLVRRRRFPVVAGRDAFFLPDTRLVGSSPAMRRLQAAIARTAPIGSPALIVGESGTGKELVARELHRLGPGGPDAPFVAVNSAALPEQLVESELFGHERGAFTGAAWLRKGAFESAGRGTMFLDEIGDLPPPAQAKLLRVLEERQVTRVGGNRVIPVEARVVAATNRELDGSTAGFRRDLYYRLNVHVIAVPPLRDRLSDIPELVARFVGIMCPRFGVPPKTVEPEVLAALASYDWRKNNVRELRNTVERMIVATEGDVIPLAAVPAEIRGEMAETPEAPTLHRLRADAERGIVRAALERNGWRVTKTARELGLADHASLHKVMKRLGISVR